MACHARNTIPICQAPQHWPQLCMRQSETNAPAPCIPDAYTTLVTPFISAGARAIAMTVVREGGGVFLTGLDSAHAATQHALRQGGAVDVALTYNTESAAPTQGAARRGPAESKGRGLITIHPKWSKVRAASPSAPWASGVPEQRMCWPALHVAWVCTCRLASHSLALLAYTRLGWASLHARRRMRVLLGAAHLPHSGKHPKNWAGASCVPRNVRCSWALARARAH